MARYTGMVGGRQPSGGATGKALLVDAPQTLTGVEKNQALANLWPVYTGGDGTTSSADFTMAGLNLRWGAAENTSLDPYGVTAYRSNNRRERCALTAGGVTLYDPDGNALAYYTRDSATFYSEGGDRGWVDFYRTSHAQGSWSLDLNPMDGLWFNSPGNDPFSINADGLILFPLRNGSDARLSLDSSEGFMLNDSGGQLISLNKTNGFTFWEGGSPLHEIARQRIRFFGAPGITAPRPAASTTTLADVIALLTDLGFVQ